MTYLPQRCLGTCPIKSCKPHVLTLEIWPSIKKQIFDSVQNYLCQCDIWIGWENTLNIRITVMYIELDDSDPTAFDLEDTVWFQSNWHLPWLWHAWWNFGFINLSGGLWPWQKSVSGPMCWAITPVFRAKFVVSVAAKVKIRHIWAQQAKNTIYSQVSCSNLYGAVHLYTTNFVQWPNWPMKIFWHGNILKSQFWPANRANGGEIIVLRPNNCVQADEVSFQPFCSCNGEEDLVF